MKKKFKPKPNSMWLVVYEYRYEVIRVSPQGDGFFAPGQEPCWGFSNVQEWTKEITTPDIDVVSKEGTVFSAKCRKNCKNGMECPKRPGNSLPLSKEAKLCKGCDVTGKDVAPRKPKYSSGPMPSTY